MGITRKNWVFYQLYRPGLKTHGFVTNRLLKTKALNDFEDIDSSPIAKQDVQKGSLACANPLRRSQGTPAGLSAEA